MENIKRKEEARECRGRGFSRLSLKEREQMAILHARGYSIREIGFKLGRSHSTISREFKRGSFNPDPKYYSPCHGDFVSRYNRQKAGRPRKMEDPAIKNYVVPLIKRGWSPEIISGRIGEDLPGYEISHETIYRYVYAGGLDLTGYLVRRQPFRKPKGNGRKRHKIPNRLAIDLRPKGINERKVPGHWESDTLVGAHHSLGINVLVERKSRYMMMSRLPDATSRSTSQAIINRLSSLPGLLRRSLTYDNGSENARHEEINETLKSRSYFCNPYHSWEKGTVENTNGLIRRYLPKKTDFSLLTDEHIRYIESELNNRPKKCLEYKTPNEVFNSLLALVQ